MNWFGTINHFPNLRYLEHVEDTLDLRNDVLSKLNSSKGRTKPLKLRGLSGQSTLTKKLSICWSCIYEAPNQFQ